MSANEVNQPNPPNEKGLSDSLGRQQDQDDFRELDVDPDIEADKLLRLYSTGCTVAGVFCLVGWLMLPKLILLAFGARSTGVQDCFWLSSFFGGIAGAAGLLRVANDVRAGRSIPEIQKKITTLTFLGAIPFFGILVLAPFAIWGTILIHRLDVRKKLNAPTNPFLELLNSIGQTRVDLETRFSTRHLNDYRKDMEDEAKQIITRVSATGLGLSMLSILCFVVTFGLDESFWSNSSRAILLQVMLVLTVPIVVGVLSLILLQMRNIWLAYTLTGLLLLLGMIPILGILFYFPGMVLLDTLARPEIRKVFELRNATNAQPQ